MKKLLILVLVIAMLFSFSIYSSALNEKTEIVVLSETDSGANNYKKLMNAFALASDKDLLTVKIQTAGNYKISTTTGAGLRIRSNTVFDLNGSTLVRSGSMGNIIQVADFSGERDATGYNLAYNIIVKNGTLDGSLTDTETGNLVNIGHSQNVNLINLNLYNCYEGHLVEYTGCKDCLIDSCTFDGYHTELDDGEEALQFDICAKVSSKSWNGIYADPEKGTDDCTPCKNMTVQNCTFKNYPSAVGNHKTVDGYGNSGIVVKNNTFINNSVGNGTGSLSPAIWCYNFDDSEVSNNIITGKYSDGIVCSGGSVSVIGNTIGISSNPVDYSGVSFTYKIGYTKGEIDVKSPKTGSTDGVISNNKIYVNGSSNLGCITVRNGCVLSEIAGNTLVNSSKADSENTPVGILITSSEPNISNVKNIKSNDITVANGYAIRVSASKVTGTIGSNTLSSNNNCIHLTSGAIINKIDGNKVKQSNEKGIYVGSNCVVDTISNNTVSNCKQTGIYGTSASTVNYLHNDIVSKCGEHNIYIRGHEIDDNLFDSNAILRTYGDSRYQTSIQTAKAYKSAIGLVEFKTIIVAYGENFADALAGSYLAAVKSAPILLVNTDVNNPSAVTSMNLVKNYIDKNLASDGTVYVLGGKNVISENYMNSLKVSGRKVKRLAGETRFETNIKILEEAGFKGQEILISDAFVYADALSASSLGKPILFIDKAQGNGRLNDMQKKYLNSIKSSVKNVYIIGGLNSVPKTIESDLKTTLRGCSFERFSGSNRYETSILIANNFYKSPNAIVLAYGHSYPDGLCGGPLAFALGAPVILTNPNDSDATFARNYAKKNTSIINVAVLGGQGSSTNPQLTNDLINSIKSGKIVDNKYN